MRLIRLCTALLCLGLGLATSAAAAAQGLPLVDLGGHADKSKPSAPHPQKLNQSLDVVIQTLQNDAQRKALLKQLKALRKASRTAAKKHPRGAKRTGLLGALEDSLSGHGRQASAAGAPLARWSHHSQRAFADLRALFTATSRAKLLRNLAKAGAGLGAWFGLLLLLMALGRLLFSRWGWSLILPPEPRPWMLLAHFLRRVLPWLLAFLALLFCLPWVAMTVPARSIVLVVAYVALCARVLTTVFDVVISLFNRAHRRVAVTILHRQALKPLFAIGVLVALSDVFDGEQLTAQLGGALAHWLSVLTSILAALISGWLVVRFRRPVEHLIRNRSYARRHNQGLRRELIYFFARLWYVPTLLVIGMSLIAVVVTGGNGNAAFTKAIVCAVLLVLASAVTDVIRQQGHRFIHRRRRSRYAQRLEHFCVVLAYVVVWVIFAVLSLRIWGFSLLGIGQPQALSPRIGHALLGAGLTGLLAWLIWISVDTAIERALSGGPKGRKKVTARAQTVIPMIRNAVFFTILIIAVIIGLANLGVNVTPLLAGAGIIGLAVGFGAQTLVHDLITGIFILIEDTMAVGDWVEINGFQGGIESLNLRTVRLRDLEGIVHSIIFSQITTVHNMSRQYGIALIKIRIPYDLPIDDAITLMRETAAELRKTPAMRGLIWSPLEMQGIHSFEDGCPILRMRMRTAPVYQWDVARAFNLLLKQRMEAQSVTLGTPRLSVSMEGAGGRRYRVDGKPEEQAADTDSPQPDRG